MSNKPTTTMKRRLNGVVALVLALFTGCIVMNLIGISIRDCETYQSLANKQQFRTRVIHANRGTIKDINGQTLAQSATVYTVFLDATMFKEYDSDKLDLIADELSTILVIDKEFIIERSKKDSKYEILKYKVEKNVVDKIAVFIEENNIHCIFYDPDTKRYYPQNDLAASVIGFTGFEGQGQYGLEAEYDEYLSGIDGKIISATDAQGKEIPYHYEQSFDAQDGNDLILNIDIVLQHYLERELKNAINTHAARNRGCGIIMNAKTGQILAMATEPDFDLNNPTEIADPVISEYLNSIEDEDEYKAERSIAWETQWKNKAITELYYPGSVFKVITGSSALEEKKINLTQTFTCGGQINVSGTIFHCHGHKDHGAQTFVEAMTNSCNPAFVQIGQRLGQDLFAQYFDAYGLSTRTGIDLPGEATSIYYHFKEDENHPVELASSAFGQTNKITPLEMITAYAAVVNGGYLVTPYVVNRIVDSDGNVVKQFEPEIKRQVISEETSQIMRETLESVVKTNGGSNAYIAGYRIGGKSGTSQKIDQDLITGRKDYVASYCAFAPADDPEIIMLVMVDEPTAGEYYGSKVAAPVVRSVFEEALPYLGYFPEYTDEELAEIDVIIPNVVDKSVDNAKATLINLGLNVEEVVGNGSTVVKQIPSSGNKIPAGGSVILYTEEDIENDMVTVPAVYNKSLQDANVAITNAGLNFKPVGGAVNHVGAYAVNQNYAEGEKVPRGTIIEVTFMVNDETG